MGKNKKVNHKKVQKQIDDEKSVETARQLDESMPIELR